MTPDENESAPVKAVPPPAAPGTGLGAVAVVLGGLGCLLPLTPFAFSDARDWIPLVFALPGIVFGLYGCTGRNRGNMLAIVGAILCTIAIGLSTVALTKFWGNASAPGDDTEELLRDEIDVHLGEVRQDASGTAYMSVTIYNKSSDFASYTVTFDVSGGVCERTVSVRDMLPGTSYRSTVEACDEDEELNRFDAKLVKVERS